MTRPLAKVEESINAVVTLVIDEAHLIFSSDELVNDLFKKWGQNTPRFLLFSAAASGEDTVGNIVATPPEIRKKAHVVSAHAGSRTARGGPPRCRNLSDSWRGRLLSQDVLWSPWYFYECDGMGASPPG